jgi:hypothetical protein
MMQHVESIFFSVSKRLVEGQQKKTVECVTSILQQTKSMLDNCGGEKHPPQKRTRFNPKQENVCSDDDSAGE